MNRLTLFTKMTRINSSTKQQEVRIAAAAKWLMEDDSAYTNAQDLALRAAREMLRAADEADSYR
jgi:hypothetical protein